MSETREAPRMDALDLGEVLATEARYIRNCGMHLIDCLGEPLTHTAAARAAANRVLERVIEAIDGCREARS